MIFPVRTLITCAASSLTFNYSPAAAPEPAAFFEAGQPFFHSKVQLTPPSDDGLRESNFVVRGVILPLPSGHAVVFDQELLRPAGIWAVPPNEPLTTLETMPQTSYARPRRKASTEHPVPTGELLLSSGMHPGIAAEIQALFADPRPPARIGDSGRGPLPAALARFEGVELAGTTAVLSYRSGETQIREWWSHAAEGKAQLPAPTLGHSEKDGIETQLLRHLEISAHSQPLHFALGAVSETAWTLQGDRTAVATDAAGGTARFAVNSDAITLSIHRGELVATLAASSKPQRITLAFGFVRGASVEAKRGPSRAEIAEAEPLVVGPTPPLPSLSGARRWPQSVTSSAQLESLSQNGLVLDRISVPEENPWNRRVRAADLAFLDGDRAAVVTYDGDVWMVSGLADPDLAHLTWRRFASGLHEPLAIAAPGDVVQVATKNGVVRLHDRDTNGEADWFENFNDHLIQSQNNRSFPLDMAVGPDGSTFVTQGGIVNQSGIKSGGTGTPHTGGVLKISPDGRSSTLFARAAREPFIAVHPQTGFLTGTDQQGQYIPSSVAYFIREGDSFGFLEENPEKLTPPLVWLPHEQDASSSSQAWMIGEGMGPWNNRLLHLSYGTGRVFVISPDFTAPVPQAAAIPLDLKTDLPLLHARMHPNGDALFFAGFQIWGTRTRTPWALGRLRVGDTPVVTAIGAKSFAEGVILEFAEPVDPQSLKPQAVTARVWNYVRSSNYGSGRYTLEGTPGTNAIGVGQIIASADRKSVFIHLPQLTRVMQLEVRHDFRLAAGGPAAGVVYFTINQPRPLDLTTAGFPEVDLTQSIVVVTPQQEELATAELGKTLSENLGCIACHSIDGTTEGKVGPTWKHLFGTRRPFVDGTSDVADELYLREKILDPMKKRVTTGSAEMPSYRGVVSESQLESLVLYIKNLRRPFTGEATPPRKL